MDHSSSLRWAPAAPLLAISIGVAACVPVADPTPPGAVGVGAEVLRVDDGDSLRVEVGGTDEKARLLGINAPERDECMGPEARETLTNLVEGGVRLETGPEPRDQFGRLLVSVWAGEVLVNERLVSAGMALAVTAAGPYAERLLAAEETAKSNRIGLWSADVCGGGSIPDVRIEDVNPNPPGPDDDALDEETVTIGNHGGTEVDLGGWVLRDESTSNRFTFPAGTRLGPGDSLVVASGCREGPGRLAWCADSPIWNNGGDSALVLDPAGRVVDHLHYPG